MELSNNHNLYIKDGVKTGTSAETPSTCVLSDVQQGATLAIAARSLIGKLTYCSLRFWTYDFKCWFQVLLGTTWSLFCKLSPY